MGDRIKQMSYVLLAVCIVLSAFNTLGTNCSNAVTTREKFLNIAVYGIPVMGVMWLFFAFFDRTLDLIVLKYAVLYAVVYILCIVCLYSACACGPLSKTSLFLTSSLVIPLIGSVLIWHEPFHYWYIIGLVLMFASFFLLSVKEKDEKKANIKWLLLAIGVFLLNGGLNLIIKGQQYESGGKGSPGLLAISYCFIIVISLLIYITMLAVSQKKTAQTEESQLSSGLFRADCNRLSHNIKSLVLIFLGAGVGNFLATYLAGRLPGFILFPSVLGGSLIITTLVSVFVYKEKMTLRSVIGMILGGAAIVLFCL